MQGAGFACAAVALLGVVRWRASRAATARNWAGNVSFGAAAAVVRPENVEQVVEAVKRFERVKVVGTGHCFCAIAQPRPGGALLDTRKMKAVVFESGDTVTVEAGVTWGEAMDAVCAKGRALSNAPSLPHISCVGSIATGTHGTGWNEHALASQVVAVELVLADGSLARVREGDKNFAFFLVHLGALGVVTRLTLRTVPYFDIHKAVYENVSMAELRSAGLARALQSADFVSLFVDWGLPAVSSAWLGFSSLGNHKGPPERFLGAAHTMAERVHPIANCDPANCIRVGLGPWNEKLCHFAPGLVPSAGAGCELQSEWFVPLQDADAALSDLLDARHAFADLVLVTEIRVVLADRIPLSPVYAPPGDSDRTRFVAFHFTWTFAEARVLAAARLVQDVLSRFAARPHLGKIFAASRDELVVAQGDDGLDRLAALRLEMDPCDKFGNAWLDRVLGPGACSRA